MKKGAMNSMAEAMQAMNDPQVMAEAMKMMKDPQFVQQLQAMQNDPAMRRYMQAVSMINDAIIENWMIIYDMTIVLTVLFSCVLQFFSTSMFHIKDARNDGRSECQGTI
jgi:hypothetical protein